MLWNQVVEQWRHDPSARHQQTQLILEAGGPVLWETSPSRTGREPFEQTLVPVPSFAGMRADPRAFGPKLVEPWNRFSNLGGDAVLVCPGRSRADAAHLAAFLATCSEAERHGLWIAVADAITAWWRTRDATLWVSTHGGAVPWLHVRLDQRPKYYRSALRRLTA